MLKELEKLKANPPQLPIVIDENLLLPLNEQANFVVGITY
jgi:hypothetical protein